MCLLKEICTKSTTSMIRVSKYFIYNQWGGRKINRIIEVCKEYQQEGRGGKKRERNHFYLDFRHAIESS